MKFSINLRYFKDFFFSRYASGNHQYPYLCYTLASCSRVIRGRGRKLGRNVSIKNMVDGHRTCTRWQCLWIFYVKSSSLYPSLRQVPLFFKEKKINGEKLKLFISMYGIYLRIWKGPLGLVCQSRLSHTFFSSSSVNFHLFEFIYNDLPLIKSTFSSPYQTSFIQKQQWKFSQIVGITCVYVCVCVNNMFILCENSLDNLLRG